MDGECFLIYYVALSHTADIPECNCKLAVKLGMSTLSPCDNCVLSRNEFALKKTFKGEP